MYQEINAASPERARVPARPQRTQARRLPQRIEAPVFNDSHRNLNVAKLRNIEIAPVGWLLHAAKDRNAASPAREVARGAQQISPTTGRRENCPKLSLKTCSSASRRGPDTLE
jgi:hypothetical protein